MFLHVRQVTIDQRVGTIPPEVVGQIHSVQLPTRLGEQAFSGAADRIGLRALGAQVDADSEVIDTCVDIVLALADPGHKEWHAMAQAQKNASIAAVAYEEVGALEDRAEVDIVLDDDVVLWKRASELLRVAVPGRNNQ